MIIESNLLRLLTHIFGQYLTCLIKSCFGIYQRLIIYIKYVLCMLKYVITIRNQTLKLNRFTYNVNNKIQFFDGKIFTPQDR